MKKEKLFKFAFIIMFIYMVALNRLVVVHASAQSEQALDDIDIGETTNVSEDEEAVMSSESMPDSDKESYKNPEMDIQFNDKQDTFEVVLKNCDQDIDSKVKIAVWSEVGGQDDLRWYYPDKREDGSWGISGSIYEHKKDTGVYYFHAYTVKDNVAEFIIAQKVQIEGIELKNDITVDKNEEKASFRVNIGQIFSPADIKSLDVAVWSLENGQDDLYWYSGLQDSEGKWYVDVECKNHRYDSGTYVVHVYVEDYRSIYKYLSGIRTEFQLSFENAEITSAVNSDQSGANLVLQHVEGVRKGTFEAAVWSDENGQDDLKWYNLSKDGDKWTLSFNIKDHKYSTGVYYVHIYYKSTNDKKYIIGKKISISDISAEALKVVSCDVTKGYMELQVSGVYSPVKIKSVKAAVWSGKNGQDDLVWYDLRENGEGSWKITVPLKKHKYNLGTYYIHVYAADERGVSKCIKTTAQEVEMENSICVELNDQQNQITVSMDPEKNAEGVNSVRFAVWSDENGQDDLKWYVFDRTYTQKVEIKNHKNSTGKYLVHAYAVMVNGTMEYIGGKTFEIDGINRGTVEIVNEDFVKGTFTVTSQGATSPATIQNVRFAVWSKENGQDDLQFYTGKKIDDLWSVDVDTFMHNYESGEYVVHAYAKDSRGVEAYIGGIVFEFNQDMSGMTVEISNDQSNSSFQAILTDNNTGRDFEEVQFAVWSRVNGQDDLKWYTAQKKSDKQWSVNVQVKNHKGNSGIYYVHAYGVFKGGKKCCLKTAESMILKNWEPYIDNQNVTIENISKEYNFLFVSDTHVIVPGEKDDELVQNWGSSRMHYFTNTYGMNSEEQFPYWVNYANSHQVDGFLMGGDIIDYPSESNINYLKENLEALNTSYVYTFGNHDWAYPWEKSPEENRGMFDELVKGSGDAHFVEYEDLVVLTVDDSTYQVSEEALLVTDQALSLGKPVILMMHIPLQTESLMKKCIAGWGVPLMIGEDAQKPNDVTRKFLDKVLSEDSPVQAILTGHVHMEDTSQINEKITQYVVDMSAKGKGIMLHISN